MQETEFFYTEYLAQEPLRAFCGSLADEDALRRRREEAAQCLLLPSTERFWQHLVRLEELEADCDFYGDRLTIGKAEQLPAGQRPLLEQTLRDLRPWRKGPYSYFGTEVDSEWRSHLKWNRVMEWIKPQLTGKVIADVGCNNAYYMYKMVPFRPALVVGLDPMERYFYHFYLNRLYARVPCLQFELLGCDDLALFPGFFDVVFFMGILYHRRNPVSTLEGVCRSLKKDGLLILESAGIKGSEPYCLVPEKRYMKGKGYWFLPTASALCNLLGRTGFGDIKVHGCIKTTPEEQSRTSWVNTESLSDFLDPGDPEKTVEGYPAPYRIYISARKK